MIFNIGDTLVIIRTKEKVFVYNIKYEDKFPGSEYYNCIYHRMKSEKNKLGKYGMLMHGAFKLSKMLLTEKI